MPPLGDDGSLYPQTRQVFLGSLAQSFNRFDSISSSSSGGGQRVRGQITNNGFNRKDNYVLITTNVLY